MKPSKLFHAVVVVGAALAGGCGDDRGTFDAGGGTDAGAVLADAAIADAAMDAALAVDAGMDDAGPLVDEDAGEDAMVLIL